MSKRNPGTLGVWGPNGTRVVAAESAWAKVLKWDREAREAGERRRVFPSLCDPFEDWHGPMVDSKGNVIVSKHIPMTHMTAGMTDYLSMQEVRARLFRLIDQTPNLDWQLLTKRPENILEMACDVWGNVSDGWAHWKWPSNCWLGVSCEDQATADERIPHLLKVPAAVRFLSLEPLLGPVDLLPWFDPTGACCGGEPEMTCRDCPARADWRHSGPADEHSLNEPQIDLVIVGGESGHNARPCSIEWIRSIVRQCREAGVKCFVKQVGAKPYEHADDGPAVRSWGEAKVRPNGPWVQIHLRDPKGGDISEWPEDLKVREMP